jgi:hypothetical protein
MDSSFGPARSVVQLAVHLHVVHRLALVSGSLTDTPAQPETNFPPVLVPE